MVNWGLVKTGTCEVCGSATNGFRWCEDCRTEVLAFEPRQGDWFYVAESYEDLEKGPVDGGDQCDECGACDYVLDRDINRWVVYCHECETAYPIHWKKSGEVIF